MLLRDSRSTRRFAVVMGTCTVLLALGVTSAFALTVTDTMVLHSATNSDMHVRADGGSIVYSDTRGAPANTDIYLYNTSTSAEQRLTTNAADQTSPAIADGKVVYIDSRSGKALYVYDVASSTEKLLVTGDCYSPAIANGVVIYIEKTATDWAVRRAAVGGAIDTLATYAISGTTRPGNPTTDGTRVAWELYDLTYDGDDPEPRSDIVLWNGSSITTFSKCYAPRLVGGKLAYTSRTDGSAYLYTVSTKATKKLADDTVTLAISSTNFVGYNRLSKQVFVRNLTSGGQAALVAGLSEDWAFEQLAATSGSVFAYSNWASGGSDLHIVRFSGNVVGASTSGAAYRGRATIKGMVSSTSGKAVTGKVRLYRSANGVDWTRVATHYTTRGGTYSFKSNIVRKPTYYRVRYLGTSKKPAATSALLYVKPRVLLSRPALASSVSIAKEHTITGKVTPRIGDVSKIKLVFEFKPKNGTWHSMYMDDTNMSWTKHSGYWTYKVSFVRFDTKGSWRIRAESPELTSWAKTASKWRYVSVY